MRAHELAAVSLGRLKSSPQTLMPFVSIGALGESLRATSGTVSESAFRAESEESSIGMSVLEMVACAVVEPWPVADTSLDIRVLQRPTLVQPKVPNSLSTTLNTGFNSFDSRGKTNHFHIRFSYD
jgi:hypothetical protein